MIRILDETARVTFGFLSRVISNSFGEQLTG